MEVVVGKKAGFCAGVMNAVSKTKEIMNNEKNMYCLGELVHNEIVVNKLKNKGLVFVNDIEEVPNDSNLIIRAHGISKGIYARAKEKNIKLFDLTCPRVLSIHKKVQEKEKENKYIIIVGDIKHPEIIGIKSYAGKNYSVVNDVKDVENIICKIEKSGLKDVVIFSQTTASKDNFEKICDEFIKYASNKFDVEIQNTICMATKLRQDETKEISENVDLMVIIGGKNSSNTRKLFDISNENCISVLVSNNEEIDEYIKNNKKIKKMKKIGVMAGASTPNETIDYVVEKICKL